MNRELAKIITEMTWQQLDEFAERIMEIATDDEGIPNDERYIAQCLITDALEVTP